MKRPSTTIKVITILSFLAFINSTLTAQISLPYYSGFDDATQKAGWKEYKKAATTFSHWGYGGAGNSYSQPSSIGHDYSPSTGISLTDNWYVSPGFVITGGGFLDSIRYMFSGFSVPQAGDTIALYLLNGSPDPALANMKTLLFDFRDTEYSPDNVYRIKTNLSLNGSVDSAYLAIRYRNIDCSSQWLTVSFDNIAISGNNSVGFNDLNPKLENVNVYPNPTTGQFYIETKSKINSLQIYTATGKLVYSRNDLDANSGITISHFKAGVYIMNYAIGTKSYKKKIIVQ